MKRLYGKGALHMIPVNDGFIFAAMQSAYEDKVVVSYKLFSFESGAVSPVTRSVYLLAKFGNNFKIFERQVKDYLNCKVLNTADRKVFVFFPNGDATAYDPDAAILWNGALIYKEKGPSDGVISGRQLWCSFPESDSVVRYNIRTMREELRIGGGKTPAFTQPEGLWLADDSLLVCNTGTNRIREININAYTVQDYAVFEEPVHQYIKVNSNEIVLLDSGIYRL